MFLSVYAISALIVVIVLAITCVLFKRHNEAGTESALWDVVAIAVLGLVPLLNTFIAAIIVYGYIRGLNKRLWF